MGFGRNQTIIFGLLLLLSLVLAACGSSEGENASIPAAATSPTQESVTDTKVAPQLTATPADIQVPAVATITPIEPPPPAFNNARAIGNIDGVTFLVTDESEATFTVGEQLRNLPLPNEAILRTNALTGEVFLDGRPSTIFLDTHQLKSDQSQRDNWVRTRMFPLNKTATFILGSAIPLPDGFSVGEAGSFTISGTLEINGITIPLEFAIEARDDGDVLFILGRTTFEWSDIGMDVPSSRGTISVEDEVRVEVLLKARPVLES